MKLGRAPRLSSTRTSARQPARLSRIPSGVSPFEVVLVGAGPFGRQAVLEIYTLAQRKGLPPPRVLLVDNGDLFDGKVRLGNMGLSSQTLFNLRDTGLELVQGEQIAFHPNAKELPTQTAHYVWPQLPGRLVARAAQTTFPELLGSYDPRFAKLKDELGDNFVHLGGTLDRQDPRSLVDLEDGFALTVQTKAGPRTFYGRGVLVGSDGGRSAVRTHLARGEVIEFTESAVSPSPTRHP